MQGHALDNNLGGGLIWARPKDDSKAAQMWHFEDAGNGARFIQAKPWR